MAGNAPLAQLPAWGRTLPVTVFPAVVVAAKVDRLPVARVMRLAPSVPAGEPLSSEPVELTIGAEF